MERDGDHKVRNPERDSVGKSQAKREGNAEASEREVQEQRHLWVLWVPEGNRMAGLQPQFQPSPAVWPVKNLNFAGKWG